MISILIPTYNYTAYPLASALAQQARSMDTLCEIIIADDASTSDARKRQNRAIASLPHCTYLELENNIGRASIRNLLADKAKGEWLLFLDCDGLPLDNHFLTRYRQAITGSPQADIICGGIIHPQNLPSHDKSLRYFYEKKAEKHHTVAIRNERPYACFRTFNFMIRRSCFQQVRFDESFRHYGYEDVLFGIQLQERGFHILHIDNPLENQDIEPNDVFLKKTEEALRTLAGQVDKLGNSVQLHRFYLRLGKVGLTPLVRITFRILR
ncbi:MAG: glycosyltransferase family 2 protein, partial [Bacteroidaceae bacterium]|nr:glycosyltransferase family 2 protein [Bacteroidaceae bacterium]